MHVVPPSKIWPITLYCMLLCSMHGKISSFVPQKPYTIQHDGTATSLLQTSKKEIADVGMAQWVHCMAEKYSNKKCHTHSDMHSTPWSRLLNNHPYISSSGTPVGTKFLLLLMWGWLLNNLAVLWSAYHCVHGNSCFCTSSASAFIEPSLHQLDFF